MYQYFVIPGYSNFSKYIIIIYIEGKSTISKVHNSKFHYFLHLKHVQTGCEMKKSPHNLLQIIAFGYYNFLKKSNVFFPFAVRIWLRKNVLYYHDLF